MTPMLKIVTRVIKRHMEAGQAFEKVIANYPKLTAEEIELIRNEVLINV